MPEHSHCLFCGDPIRFGDDYCSEECAKHFAKKKKKDALRENGFFLIAIIGVIALSVILYMVR